MTMEVRLLTMTAFLSIAYLLKCTIVLDPFWPLTSTEEVGVWVFGCITTLSVIIPLSSKSCNKNLTKYNNYKDDNIRWCLTWTESHQLLFRSTRLAVDWVWRLKTIGSVAWRQWSCWKRYHPFATRYTSLLATNRNNHWMYYQLWSLPVVRIFFGIVSALKHQIKTTVTDK